MKRIAFYRVSTESQTVDPQQRELAEYCKRRGWQAAQEYCDEISGAKFSRAGLNKLMAAVRKRAVDVVVCVKLDRLGRSLPHLAQMIAEFDAHGVALICTSQGIDTSNDNPAGRLQMHVLMAVAEFERSPIRERTKAGLDAARARGSKLGRRKFKLRPYQIEMIKAYRRANDGPTTLKALARTLGCSIGLTHKLVHQWDRCDGIRV